MRYWGGKPAVMAQIGLAKGQNVAYTSAPIQVAAVGTLPNSSLSLRKHLLHRALDFWPYLLIAISIIGLAYRFWPLIR